MTINSQPATPQPATLSHPAATGPGDPRQRRRVRKVIESKRFASLATTSPAGRPHVAGVLYQAVDGQLWVHTMASSRKARSIRDNPYVAVCIPFRKLPAGPPYTVAFQGTAELVAMDDPHVVELLAAKRLDRISGHGALEEPDGVFVRITPHRTVHSYGLGANPLDLVRDPLHSGAATVWLDEP